MKLTSGGWYLGFVAKKFQDEWCGRASSRNETKFNIHHEREGNFCEFATRHLDKNVPCLQKLVMNYTSNSSWSPRQTAHLHRPSSREWLILVIVGILPSLISKWHHWATWPSSSCIYFWADKSFLWENFRETFPWVMRAIFCDLCRAHLRGKLMSKQITNNFASLSQQVAIKKQCAVRLLFIKNKDVCMWYFATYETCFLIFKKKSVKTKHTP